MSRPFPKPKFMMSYRHGSRPVGGQMIDIIYACVIQLRKYPYTAIASLPMRHLPLERIDCRRHDHEPPSYAVKLLAWHNRKASHANQS